MLRLRHGLALAFIFCSVGLFPTAAAHAKGCSQRCACPLECKAGYRCVTVSCAPSCVNACVKDDGPAPGRGAAAWLAAAADGMRPAPGRRLLRQGAASGSAAAASDAAAAGLHTFGGPLPPLPGLGGAGCAPGRFMCLVPPCANLACPDGTFCWEDPCRPCAAACVPAGGGVAVPGLGPGGG
ncbi:hypothetical protein Rsub_12247 [Raphidocelis subcapitata]|uniref:Bowman-Birk serine protease inhibitors family domain-containing protein n=1 Tax=Raphidocelis subcapitata TaxID=307507 RepID=A0A2V0PQD1_9CHLO|nr:hypothetical protein Rsub_12247 [Raphidocelis subcapitata]|eukprot:GBF99415.1 hypothetical protein Rsub_12247 [Raphidocelis subcapitata]